MLRLASCAIVLTAAGFVAAVFAPEKSSVVAAEAGEVAASSYRLDAVHSSVVYRIKHNDVSFFYGRFNEMSGSIDWDQDNPANSAITIEIKAESVDSGNARRDGHLRSADFFNVTEHPTIRFTSSKIEHKGGAMYVATGELSLHGVTRTITADLEMTGSRTTGRGANVMGLEATFTIKRSEFNMTYGIEQGALGDEVRIIAGLQGVRS